MNSDSDTSEEGYERQIKPYMFEPMAMPTPAMTPNDSKGGSRLFRVQNRIKIFHQTFCFRFRCKQSFCGSFFSDYLLFSQFRAFLVIVRSCTCLNNICFVV